MIPKTTRPRAAAHVWAFRKCEVHGRDSQRPLYVDTGHFEPSGASSAIRPIEAFKTAVC